ncbi:hypothetical protein [Endozoicomonas numazuensis]|uniref:Uncharacterized protein n=1 Tax=Endozoicomonas numazuensis TaxID=1137799 RepID=A0A081NGK6_9GAMM|nr:hypothetical protein [Endozoicomonas numazuensis]KEQ17579.1 hypothetical protein GZ78_17750 [Endozoicomonas numazuensis]
MDKWINQLKNGFNQVKATFFEQRDGAAISPFKAILGIVILTGVFVLMLPLIMLIFMVQMGLILVGMVAVLFMGTRKQTGLWPREEKLVNPEPEPAETDQQAEHDQKKHP